MAICRIGSRLNIYSKTCYYNKRPDYYNILVICGLLLSCIVILYNGKFFKKVNLCFWIF